MATVKTNDLTTGLSGRIGQLLVFRSMRGKTFVSHAPRTPDRNKESDLQRRTRVTFRQASAWAKVTLTDAKQKAYYMQRARMLKLPNAYTAAITDYMRKPKVVRLQQGTTVTIEVTKPGFHLRDVHAMYEDRVAKPPVTIRMYGSKWLVSYDSRNTSSSVELVIIDNFLRQTRFKTCASNQVPNATAQALH